MATRASLAGREAEAQKRIDAAAAVLADKHGIAPPVVPFERKPDHRMPLFLETHADFYEALAGTKGKTKPQPIEQLADAAAEDGVTLGVDETKDGAPVVVTEKVKKGKA